jgi:hypothetical protein
MTPEQRFLDSLLDMQEAASEAINFISGSTLEAFERDILTQRAVAMTFVLIAAAAGSSAVFRTWRPNTRTLPGRRSRGCGTWSSTNMKRSIGGWSGRQFRKTCRHSSLSSISCATRISRENDPA